MTTQRDIFDFVSSGKPKVVGEVLWNGVTTELQTTNAKLKRVWGRLKVIKRDRLEENAGGKHFLTNVILSKNSSEFINWIDDALIPYGFHAK